MEMFNEPYLLLNSSRVETTIGLRTTDIKSWRDRTTLMYPTTNDRFIISLPFLLLLPRPWKWDLLACRYGVGLMICHTEIDRFINNRNG